MVSVLIVEQDVKRRIGSNLFQSVSLVEFLNATWILKNKRTIFNENQTV